MNGKGRPEKLTDELKREIADNQKKRKKKLKAPAIQEEIKQLVEAQVRKEATDRGLNWSEGQILGEVKEKLPGISSIQKYLQGLEKRDKPSPLDKPWHLGLMAKPEYNLPPEAVPYILLVQRWAEKHPNVFNQPHEPLTIRQALWVSRLCGHIAYLSHLKPKWGFVYFLFQWSEAYARRERICELSDTPFDTFGFDKGIIDGGLPITAGGSTLIHYPDKSFSIDTIDKDLLQQMEQMKKEGEK